MSRNTLRSLALSTLAGAIGLASVTACGNAEKDKYQPHPAYSGAKVNMPALPNLPQKPLKNGDVYTVWGASLTLRSRIHGKEIKGKEIKIAGYVVKTNLPDAPACAVHKGGKADPPDCKAPVPTFWLGDTADAPLDQCIQVMGFASNFAQIYDALEHYHKEAKAKKDKIEPKMDTFWAVEIPNPLPVKGMKITLTADYGPTFSKTSQGAVADPIMGMLAFKKMEVTEKGAEEAILPGMKLD